MVVRLTGGTAGDGLYTMYDESMSTSAPPATASASPTAQAPSAATVAAFRGNVFGVMLMLIVQFALGMWVNLYATIPAADSGAGVLDGAVRAITNGPLGLTLHAILGIGILASAIAATVRSVAIGSRAWVVVAGLGLLAAVIAALAGTRFVGTGGAGASFLMALTAAFAMLCYALLLFRAGVVTAGG
jgi:hypothetical protein